MNTWLPTTVHADKIQGPQGRLAAAEPKAIPAAVIQALDLHGQAPWPVSSELTVQPGGSLKPSS